MTTRITTHALLVGLLLTLLGIGTQAQEDPQATAGRQRQPQQEEPGRPIVSAADLQTEFVNLESGDAIQIYELARQFYGRFLYVQERGGYHGDSTFNLHRLGNALLIYDTPEMIASIGAKVRELDAAISKAHGASQRPPEVESLQWTPRHVSVESAWRAVVGMQRSVMITDASGQRSQVPNVTKAEEAGMLVLRETPDQMAILRGLLERVDQPEPQLMLTCMVIAATDSAVTGPELPGELVADLATLVPFEHFSLLSLGVMRSSVRSERIELSMDSAYQLRLSPEAFDADGGQLTAKVMFEGRGQAFETRTTIGLGDFTVLGATGREPMFVVLQARALEVPTRTDRGAGAR